MGRVKLDPEIKKANKKASQKAYYEKIKNDPEFKEKRQKAQESNKSVRKKWDVKYREQNKDQINDRNKKRYYDYVIGPREAKNNE